MAINKVSIVYEGRPDPDADWKWDISDIRQFEKRILVKGRLQSDVAGFSSPDLKITIGRNFKLKFVFSEASRKKCVIVNLQTLPQFEHYIAKLLFEEGQAANVNDTIRRAFQEAEQKSRRSFHEALGRLCAEKIMGKVGFCQGSDIQSEECTELFRALAEMSIDYNFSKIQRDYLVERSVA